MEIKVGFLGVLTIVFIVLKLTGVIVWSWWWVVAPMWLPIAVIVGLIALGIVAFLVCLAMLVLAAIALTPIMGKQWVKDNIVKIKTRVE